MEGYTLIAAQIIIDIEDDGEASMRYSTNLDLEDVVEILHQIYLSFQKGQDDLVH